MTREVNAAIEGALAGGADEVIVNDSHDGMRNLIPEELHPAVPLHHRQRQAARDDAGRRPATGSARVFYTGYHAKAGTPDAPLAHTWTGWLNDVRIDGRSTGEFGINAVVAGHFGVPVALVTGDDKAVAQTRELLGEQVVGVVVKEGLSTFAAIHLHPDEGAGADPGRVRRRRSRPGQRTCKPYHAAGRRRGRAGVRAPGAGRSGRVHPGVERGGERSVAFGPADGLDFIRTFRAIDEGGARSGCRRRQGAAPRGKRHTRCSLVLQRTRPPALSPPRSRSRPTVTKDEQLPCDQLRSPGSLRPRECTCGLSLRVDLG